MTGMDITKMMEADSFIKWVMLLVPILLSIVQVSKININPWDSIFGWIGERINGKLESKIGNLEQEVTLLADKVEGVKEDGQKRAVSDMRWHILNFALQCRKNEEHTKEQWNHVLDQCKEYEDYVEKHEITNGVIEEDTKYIRELYGKLAREGKVK